MSLSEKRETDFASDFYYWQNDIKEFIKKLRNYDKNKLMGKDFILISKDDLNKLLGDKFNE